MSFTVKRVKRNPKEMEGDEPGVGRRRVRRRNSKAGDTLHPRALARERWDLLYWFCFVEYTLRHGVELRYIFVCLQSFAGRRICSSR